MVKLEMISRPFQPILFTVIKCNSESNCTCWATSTFLDVMLEKISIIETLMEFENCQIRGQVPQYSPPRTRNHRMDMYGRERDCQENKRPPDQTLCGQWFGKYMSDASKRKEKQKWAIEIAKLHNARKLHGIYFVDPSERSRKLEIPMPAAMPCKLQRDKYRETCRVEKKCKIKSAPLLRSMNLQGSAWKDLFTRTMKITLQEKGWIHWVTTIWCASMGRPVARLTFSSLNLPIFWKPVNPQECVWKNLYQNIMRTILQEEGDNSLQHYNMVHKFVPMSQAMNIPAAKAAVDKNGKNWKGFRRGTWHKSETNQRWSTKQRRRAQKFILPHWWTSVIWRMLNWRQSTKNRKVDLYSKETSWKMILDRMQYSPTKDYQHHKWQQPKSWISFPDCLVAWTSSGRSIGLYPSKKWKMLPNYWKFPNRSVQTFGFVYHDTNGLNHGPVWKIESFLLSEICTVIHWQDCCGNGNLRKSW